MAGGARGANDGVGAGGVGAVGASDGSCSASGAVVANGAIAVDGSGGSGEDVALVVDTSRGASIAGEARARDCGLVRRAAEVTAVTEDASARHVGASDNWIVASSWACSRLNGAGVTVEAGGADGVIGCVKSPSRGEISVDAGGSHLCRSSSGAEVSLGALAGGRSETGSGAVPSAAAQVAVLRVVEAGARRVGSSGARRERRTASFRAVTSSGAENGNLRDGTDGAVITGGARAAGDGPFTRRVGAISARSGSGRSADGCASVVDGGDGEGKSEERAVVAARAGATGFG